MDHLEEQSIPQLNESESTRSYPLLPDETLRSITPHPTRTNSEKASSTKELLRLTRAVAIQDIGKAGPSIASLPLASSSNEKKFSPRAPPFV